MGILQSIFGPLLVEFGPLRVNLGPLEVHFCFVVGVFGLW